MTKKALILLSTFQGEKYLAAQLDSLIAQSFQDWILLIRDDGSQDGTISLIKHYVEKDKRILFIEDEEGNLKPSQSFSLLMQHALKREEKYIFFCDQDDIWLPDKLSSQLKQFQDLEIRYGKKTPLLVHSDLCVVDNELKTIHSSFLKFENLKRNTLSPFKTLLVKNFVTGCSMGLNRALLHHATPVPEKAIMHDWWCALCASAVGQIGFLPRAYVLYRQHADNTIGSVKLKRKFSWKILKNQINMKIKNVRLSFLQAAALNGRLNSNNPHVSFLSSFVAIPKKNKLMRIYAASKLGLQLDYLRLFFFLMILPMI